MPKSLPWSAKEGRRAENQKPRKGEQVPQDHSLEKKMTEKKQGKLPFHQPISFLRGQLLLPCAAPPPLSLI